MAKLTLLMIALTFAREPVTITGGSNGRLGSPPFSIAGFTIIAAATIRSFSGVDRPSPGSTNVATLHRRDHLNLRLRHRTIPRITRMTSSRHSYAEGGVWWECQTPARRHADCLPGAIKLLQENALQHDVVTFHPEQDFVVREPEAFGDRPVEDISEHQGGAGPLEHIVALGVSDFKLIERVLEEHSIAPLQGLLHPNALLLVDRTNEAEADTLLVVYDHIAGVSLSET